MSVSIRNVEKFFNDHPEFEYLREDTISVFRKEANAHNIMSGFYVTRVFGALAHQFLNDLKADEEHQKLWEEDFAKMKKSEDEISCP
jgi:hypothetical protein